jgi:putative flippase GtrA
VRVALFERVTSRRVVRLAFQTLRAGAAGILATAIDLATLTILVSGFHVSAHVANVPALIAGGVANFAGNRWFAFRARDASLAKQALGYAIVELLALALNGWLFEIALRTIPNATHAYWAVRLVTSHIVFLCWSYPLWCVVFRARGQRGGRPSLAS